MSRKYLAVKPLCNHGGLVIININYGVDDMCQVGYDFGNGLECVREHKIQERHGRRYIWKGHQRHYLDQFMKT